MTVGQSSFSAAASGGAISSRGAAYCGLPPGVASAARLFETAVRGGRHEIEFWAGTIATFRSPASAVPLGTPTGEMNSLKGMGAMPNFL